MPVKFASSKLISVGSLSGAGSKIRIFTKVAHAGHIAAVLLLVSMLSARADATEALSSLSRSDIDAEEIAALRFDHDSDVHLSGRDARLQLIVSAVGASGELQDVSDQVDFVAEPEGIVEFSGSLLIPLQNGSATVVAKHSSGLSSECRIEVVDMGDEPEISFPGKIIPIFTKLGCNGGGCHGKASGQNGFKLSLLGFGPREDHEHLVAESRGRRISLANPDGSLLLLKAINASPHGGGQRLDQGSHEYRILRRWIAQGMPYGASDAPEVVAIDVLPKHRRMQSEGIQQLSVIARYSDGSSEDVTRAAVFESNDPEMASVTPEGLVALGDVVGDIAVMTRYQGHVSAFRADIPLPRKSGEPLPSFPETTDNLVDIKVWKKLRSLGVPLSPRCDDSTFIRRVTLDIAGRLPSTQEANEFLADSGQDKRNRLIDRLLDSGDYADHFAAKWNAILRNRRSGNQLRFVNVAFHQWIRDSIYQNKPYDQFAREIVTASGSVASHPPVAWFQQVPDTNQRIEDAAQLFLGQRIQCARCHHHPYEKWSQADYTQLSAFFVTVSKKNDGDPGEPLFFTRVGGATARDPSSGQNLMPAGLDADTVNVENHVDPRVAFASWMIEPENPFFARAFVNRYWKHFLGRGLVEPEDDLRVTNPPSNPELLDGLAEYFVESGFDPKALIRLIVSSHTYQLGSDALENNLGDRRSYSRYYPKRLQAEVLLDAIDHVTENPTRFAGMPPGTRAVALPDTNFSSYFLTVFGRPQSSTACECERSQEANLSQSLHLLNSEEIQNKLSADNGRAARLAADARSDHEKIHELYQAALSRPPSDAEIKTTLKYVSAKENRREAYEDLIWSLINSKEFLFNH